MLKAGRSFILWRGIRSGPMSREAIVSLEELVRGVLHSQDPRVPQNPQVLRDFCRRYQGLGEDDRHSFLNKLATEFDVDQRAVQGAAQAYVENSAKEHQDIPLARLEEKLRVALTPKYMELFQQIGRLEGGVKFLVDLRGNIIDLISKQGSGTLVDMTVLRAMGAQLKDLLSIWFSAGLMKVERITWQSPCQMLQKISEYEAVHPVRGWVDLKRRVGAYRRCFVFSHSSMPHEPLVVLHVALMQHIADSIKDIVRHQRSHEAINEVQGNNSLSASMDALEDPAEVKAAIFYSITSTQKGLQGIELGKHLIKHAVRDLQSEHPTLNTFSTLSPVPGFRDWLLNDLTQAVRGNRPSPLPAVELEEITDEKDPKEALAMVLEMIRAHMWYRNDVLTQRVHRPLMKLCAQYLYLEKHRGLALNGVANFHLKNGAVLWRLNWLADTSHRGLINSCSIMVNYRYFLDQIDHNSTQYCSQGTIATSDQVLSYISLAPASAGS